jgi:hypothetical protein
MRMVLGWRCERRAGEGEGATPMSSRAATIRGAMSRSRDSSARVCRRLTHRSPGRSSGPRMNSEN